MKVKAIKNQNIQKKMIFQTKAKVFRQIEIWSKSWWKEFAQALRDQVQVSRKSWEIGGSKIQADSASQAAYPQQLVLSFSDYDQNMMYIIIDQGSKKTIETGDIKAIETKRLVKP